MGNMEAYLDNSATTKPTAQVIEAMVSSMKHGFFNPSSLYRPAMEAERAMEECRAALAGTVKGDRGQVVFTSGGTEANNLAILGHMATRKKPGRLLYSAVEHPSVKEACKALEARGHRAVEIPVTGEGTVSLPALREMLGPDVHMLCVMQVNNETGAVQPLSEVAALRQSLAPEAAFHVDGVQGFLRIPFSMKELQVSSYSVSAHKIGGPKGVGALITEKGHRILPELLGGGQEKGLRSGTENTPGIAGLRCAIEGFPEGGSATMRALKERLYVLLKEQIPALCRLGPVEESPYNSPHILNVAFPPVRGETLLHALEGDGVYVSTGSACASRKTKISESLASMGIPGDVAQCALRFSLSPYTTEAEIRYAAERTAAHYQVLSPYRRR